MIAKVANALLIAFVSTFGWSAVWSAQAPYPANATFTTLITTPFAIEGLTGDKSGNLYTVGRSAGNGNPCPVWKINIANPSLVVVGNIPAPAADAQCSPSGLALNAAGDIFVSDGNRISYFTPNSVVPPTATTYATGVPGTNGLAFDRKGNLWTGDGTTGQGRVWKIAPCSTPPCASTEVFRIQPMANDLNPLVSSGVANVGSDRRSLPGGTINPTTRSATNIGNSQPLVANGIAFNAEGNMLVADTARGALWLVKVDKNGNLISKLGCDDTFAANTLCLENLYRADPRLEGVDGIALDSSGNIWASVNERNAIVYTVFYGTSNSVEVFRNPINTTTGLRNSSATDDSKILEFPTSPFLSGTKFCTANSDNNRRDNSPSTAGEIGGTGQALGKISCMDQPLGTTGMPLPVH